MCSSPIYRSDLRARGSRPADGQVHLRRIILNADDYGISPGVSRGIRQLIAAGRLSSTSCMVTSPYWVTEARALKEMLKPDSAQIGMHFTLTDQPAAVHSVTLAPDGRYLGLGGLSRALHLRKVRLQEASEHLNRQWDTFVRELGQAPAFIDGHHHVHQLPVVRDAVLEFVATFPSSERPWIRTCWEAPARLLSRRISPLKAIAIGWYGRSLRRRCKAHDIKTNSGFAGIYDFNKGMSFPSLMRRFMRDAVDGTVIMCHPGFIDDELLAADSLAEPRQAEFDYLMSEAFGEILIAEEITLRASSLFAKHSASAQSPLHAYGKHTHSSL